jgi:mRNA interferase MazF
MSSSPPAQGEIWFVKFDPAEGREQAGDRPALVVSADELNQAGLAMVVPGTTREKPYPGRVAIPAGVGGLPRDTWFLCNHIRTVDHRRLRRRVGAPGREYLRSVVSGVTRFLKLPPE